jgi:Dinitrogenase iron-molybdenum cofactor.
MADAFKNKDGKAVYRVAVSSSDGVHIDEHFGKTTRFFIFEAAEDGGCKHIETRNVSASTETGHDEAAIAEKFRLVNDCRYVLSARAGEYVRRQLLLGGVTLFEVEIPVKQALDKIIQYSLKGKKSIDRGE